MDTADSERDHATILAATKAAADGGHLGSPLEVLRVFLKLGVSRFGGPIAHIGYFREEFVVRRRWLDEQSYVDLVALCQFLPGPASSQVGFSIGLMRAGYVGGLAAWTGFTLLALRHHKSAQRVEQLIRVERSRTTHPRSAPPLFPPLRRLRGKADCRCHRSALRSHRSRIGAAIDRARGRVQPFR